MRYNQAYLIHMSAEHKPGLRGGLPLLFRQNVPERRNRNRIRIGADLLQNRFPHSFFPVSYTHLDSLPVSLKSDPFGCRLWAAWSAYREYETLCSSAFRLWEQEGSGLYLGLVDDALLLFPAEKRETGQEDWEEIISFLPLSGARKVLCPAFCGERLGLSTELQGRILRKKSAVLVKETSPLSIQEEELPSLQAVYDLLIACRSQTFCPPRCV